MLIAGDRELEDRYVVELMRPIAYSTTPRNPIVKIKTCLKYPIQHAIIWPEIPCENKPIDEGIICRLKAFSIATEEDIMRFRSYDESLKAAQEEALQQARQEGNKTYIEIILRHMRGEYKRPRILTTYKEWEINAMR